MQNKRVLFIVPKGERYASITKLAKEIAPKADIKNDEASGYKALKTGDYDLVITSMFAGKLNGYELVSRIKRDKLDCGVILLMGDSKDKIKRDLVGKGVYSFVKTQSCGRELVNLIHSYFTKDELCYPSSEGELRKEIFELESKVFTLEQELLSKAEEVKCLNDKEEKLLSDCKDTQRRLDKKRKYLIDSERMISVGQVTASIVHEINNPLTVITSLSGLMLIECKDNERISKYNTTLSENLDRLNNLTTSVLAFANPRNSEIAEDVMVNLAILDLLTFYGYEIKRNDLVLEKNFGSGLPKVSIPKVKLQQVVLNILKNAIFAVDKGSGVISITTSSDDKYVTVQTKDNGKGIKKDNLLEVFEPFFTTKSRIDGTGMGLYICKEIIESFNGDISVKSTLDKGTEVTFRLPAIKDK